MPNGVRPVKGAHSRQGLQARGKTIAWAVRRHWASATGQKKRSGNAKWRFVLPVHEKNTCQMFAHKTGWRNALRYWHRATLRRHKGYPRKSQKMPEGAMCPDGKIKNNCSSWHGKLRARASLQNKNASVIPGGTAKKRLMFPGFMQTFFYLHVERRSRRRVSVSSTPTALL